MPMRHLRRYLKNQDMLNKPKIIAHHEHFESKSSIYTESIENIYSDKNISSSLKGIINPR